jgi:aminoglycoside phosphotransferase (APT) family kinase protein
MGWPAAEVTVNEDLVRRLLSEQHPDLADLPLRLCDAGWDNVMWRLGDAMAVRLPRRQLAAALVESEQRWLPGLAPLLPLAVPVPIRAGRPSDGYPWHWSVVPWIEGEPGDRTPVTDHGRSAERLGAFLRALHRPAPPDAPHNPWRSGPLESRHEAFEERLAGLSDHVDAVAVRRAWDDSLSARPHPGPPVWCHGDLHPANTLVRDGVVVAVIDFGDLCAGDPAVDLGAACMSVTGASHERLWASYGDGDPDLVARGRGWAVFFSVLLLDIGLQGRPSYAEVGRSKLECLLGSPGPAGRRLI